jgi:hypothetical protein
MAFGVTKAELIHWRRKAEEGSVAFLTHFWQDARFPEYKTVTKAACSDRETLISWGKQHGLKADWIHTDSHFPHFDLIGESERRILELEGESAKLEELHRRLREKNSNYK